MQTIKTSDWYYTAEQSKRGYIVSSDIKELWFHTGTACNLSCSFCLEGSKPGDNRLQRITLEDIKPFVQEATELGVEQFSFTGGEPFVVKQFVDILQYAATYKPCLVLTNGTDPVLQRLEQIKTLQNTAFPVSFRISLDHHEAVIHDIERGEGSFVKSLEAIKHLLTLGFSVSVARQMATNEDTQAVNAAFKAVFKRYDIPDNLVMVAFPDFLTPNSDRDDIPEISENCMTQYHTEHSRAKFMCAFSKMIIKKDNKMRVYACTLVDDDENYDMGDTLAGTMNQNVILKHHRCFSCFKYGASCSER